MTGPRTSGFFSACAHCTHASIAEKSGLPAFASIARHGVRSAITANCFATVAAMPRGATVVGSTQSPHAALSIAFRAKRRTSRKCECRSANRSAAATPFEIAVRAQVSAATGSGSRSATRNASRAESHWFSASPLRSGFHICHDSLCRMNCLMSQRAISTKSS